MLVGINLLREGLDLPEVSLVAILDADKEGFLRSAGSLIQTSGRAARNVNGRVIMYADTMTASMKSAIAETERRRTLQQAYNEEHGITPGVGRARDRRRAVERLRTRLQRGAANRSRACGSGPQAELDAEIARLQAEMKTAAANLDFERAAELRDTLKHAAHP